MSIRASNWAWETARRLELSQGEVLVLVRIADHADNEGVCWPGIGGPNAKRPGIADYTCMDESTVRRKIKLLEGRGLLHRERRLQTSGRGRDRDTICLHLDQAGELPGRTGSGTKRANCPLEDDGPTGQTPPVDQTRPTGQSDPDQPGNSHGSYIERNHQGTVDTPDQRSGVSRTKAEIPDYVSSLLPHLNRVGERKAAKRLSPDAVHRHCEKFADRDFEVEVEKFADYWLTGAGQNRDLNDVAGAWRNWLRTAPPMGRRARIVAEDRRRARDDAATDAGKRALRDRIADAEQKARAA